MRIGLLMRPTYVDGNDVDVNRFKREVSAEPDDVCLLNAGATGRCGCRFRHEVPENRLACLEAPRRRLRGPSLLPPVCGMSGYGTVSYGAEQRSLSSMDERWRHPDAALQRRGGRRALSRKPGNRLTPVRRAPDQRLEKTGPICISRRLLEPCAHGAGLVVAAFSARDILRVKLTGDGGRDNCDGVGLRKTAPLLLHLLGLLGDFLGRLGSLLCFLRFLCHVFLVGLAGLTNVRTLRTSAQRHQANTKLAKTIPR